MRRVSNIVLIFAFVLMINSFFSIDVNAEYRAIIENIDCNVDGIAEPITICYWYTDDKCNAQECSTANRRVNWLGACAGPVRCDDSCYPKTQCDDGSYAACGSTCNDSENPGDPCVWGSCSVACGGGIQYDSCGNSRACNTGACCTNIGPNKPYINYPKDNDVNGGVYPAGTTSIEFNWGNNPYPDGTNHWGIRCAGDNKKYRLMIFTGTCDEARASNVNEMPTTLETNPDTPGTWYRAYANPGTPTKVTLSGIFTSGRDYCWRIWKRNYGSIFSGMKDFRIEALPMSTPTVNAYCVNGTETFNLNINWANGRGPFRIDISGPSNTWSNPFWDYQNSFNRTYNGRAWNFTSTARPYTKLGAAFTPSPSLTNPAQYYTISVFDAATGLRSPGANFYVPFCDQPGITSFSQTCSATDKLISASWNGNSNSYALVIRPGNVSDPNGTPRYVRNVGNTRSVSNIADGSFLNGATPLTLSSNSTYTFWVYDARSNKYSVPQLFNASSCCGDAVREGSEACDAGAGNTNTCNSGAANTSTTCCSTSCTNITSWAPKGYQDGISCTALTGWTCDPDNYNSALSVHVYSPNTSVPPAVGVTTANLPAEIGVQNACGGVNAHRFSFPIPASQIDGTVKQFTAYAINIGNGANPPLALGVNTLDTFSCFTRPTQTFAGVINDTCNGWSSSATSIHPNKVNPIIYKISGGDDFVDISNVDLVMIPNTLSDGMGVSASAAATITRTQAVQYTQQNQALMVTYQVGTDNIATFNTSGVWAASPASTGMETFGGTYITAVNKGTKRNPDIEFTVRFGDGFYNGTYSVYNAIINSNRGTISNDPFKTAGLTGQQINDGTILNRNGVWNIDLDPPQLIMGDPSYVTNASYTIKVNGSELTGAGKQSGIDVSNSRYYVNSTSAAADYYYRSSINPVNTDVNIINRAAPSFNTDPNSVGPLLSSSVANGTYAFFDRNPDSEIPVGHSYYLSDTACNVTVATKNAQATQLVEPWIMAVGGGVSVGGSITNIEIPNINLSIDNIYRGLAALATESILTGRNALPIGTISTKGNFITSYTDDAINVPGDSEFNDWYSHMLDKITTAKNINITSSGTATLQGRIGATVGEESPVRALMYDSLAISSGTLCTDKTIIFLKGNLTIDPDFTNNDSKSACIFIVQGDVTVTKGTRKTNEEALSANPSSYDIIDGFFIVNGTFNLEVDNDPGNNWKWDGLMLRGGVYAQNMFINRDLNSSGNGNLERPAFLVIYDPRYKEIYGKIFTTQEYSIRENLD